MLGFERFEHYPAHSPYFGAIAGLADAVDRLLRFEAVCRRQAIRTATTAGLLFHNCSPQALEDPDLRARIARAHIDIEYTKLLALAREQGNTDLLRLALEYAPAPAIARTVKIPLSF